MPYLVDGNNLAHVLGLTDGSLVRRDDCVRLVTGFCRTRGARAIVVFDGPARSTAGSADPRVTVRFSEGQSADEMILALLARARAPRDSIVVTSDKSLGDKARHRGATLLRSHEFASRVRQARAEEGRSVSNGERDRRPSEAEVAEWLSVFEDGRGAKR